MFKFTTAAILAAGAAAISLTTEPPSENPIDMDRIGTDITDRTEATIGVLDINNDDVVTVSEMSYVILMAENSSYIDHDEARTLAYIITHLFYLFGEEITLGEINASILDIVMKGEADFPYEHIMTLIE